MQKAEALDAELSGDPDPVARSAARKNIDLHALSDALAGGRARAGRRRGSRCGRRGSTGCSDPSATPSRPRTTSPTCAGCRPSPISTRRTAACPSAWTRWRASASTCRRTSGIRLDLDDRPQKSPRACVIASDPPTVVHLITRAQGGLHDYQAFLHEAGHALHYAGLDPELPYTFRRLSRDHALTEIYSFLLESITREPGWHALHFGARARTRPPSAPRPRASSRCSSSAATRRSSPTSSKFWADFENANDYAQTYEDNLRAAVGFHYRADGYLADMDGDFYSADYLRAWIRAAQLRAHLRGDDRRGLVAAAGDRASSCGRSSPGHAPRARRSPTGSATTRSTRRRSSASRSSPRSPRKGGTFRGRRSETGPSSDTAAMDDEAASSKPTVPARRRSRS